MTSSSKLNKYLKLKEKTLGILIGHSGYIYNPDSTKKKLMERIKKRGFTKPSSVKCRHWLKGEVFSDTYYDGKIEGIHSYRAEMKKKGTFYLSHILIRRIEFEDSVYYISTIDGVDWIFTPHLLHRIYKRNKEVCLTDALTRLAETFIKFRDPEVVNSKDIEKNLMVRINEGILLGHCFEYSLPKKYKAYFLKTFVDNSMLTEKQNIDRPETLALLTELDEDKFGKWIGKNI